MLLIPASATTASFENEFCRVSIDGPTVQYYSFSLHPPYSNDYMLISLCPEWTSNMIESREICLYIKSIKPIYSNIDTTISPRYILENETYLTSIFGVNGTISWQIIDDQYNEKLVVEVCAPFQDKYLFASFDSVGDDTRVHQDLETFKKVLKEVTISPP